MAEVVDWEKVYKWVVRCAATIIEPGMRVDSCIGAFLGNLVTQACIERPDWDFPTPIEVMGVCYLMGMNMDGFSLRNFSVDGQRLPQEENDVFDGSIQNPWNFPRLVRLTFIKYRENTDKSLEECVDLAIPRSFPSINNWGITVGRRLQWKNVMEENFIGIMDQVRSEVYFDRTNRELREHQEALSRIIHDPATGAEDP